MKRAVAPLAVAPLCAAPLAVAVLVAAGCRRAPTPPVIDADAGAAIAPAPAPPAACRATDPAVPDPGGLALLDQLTGTLRISLSAPATRFAPTDLRAEQPPPGATITAVELALYRRAGDGRAPLAAGDLDRVIFRGAVLRLRSFGELVEHTDADCAYTLRDLAHAIEATELRARAHNAWTASIDLHHVYLQGLTPGAGGTWLVGWSS